MDETTTKLVFTSESQLIELQQRIERKEPHTEEEVRAAIDFCRNKAATRAASKKAAAKVEKDAVAAVKGIDLDNFFANMKAAKETKNDGAA